MAFRGRHEDGLDSVLRFTLCKALKRPACRVQRIGWLHAMKKKNLRLMALGEFWPKYKDIDVLVRHLPKLGNWYLYLIIYIYIYLDIHIHVQIAKRMHFLVCYYFTTRGRLPSTRSPHSLRILKQWGIRFFERPIPSFFSRWPLVLIYLHFPNPQNKQKNKTTIPQWKESWG